MSMRILFMAQHYAPEEVSGAALATELAMDLVKRGHRVEFVTCAPNYPLGRVFPGYRNRLCQTERLDGVRVVRTWSYISPRKTFWPRILNYGTFSATALYGGLRAGKPDVIMSYSPPLPLGLAAWLLSCLWRVPWVLRVEDLYPDAAIAGGVLRNRAAIKFLFALERFLYVQATHISLICEGFRRNLLEKRVPAEKLSVTPVWADPGAIRPLARQNSFRAEHGLDGHFVVMYAGNLGHNSCLEDVLMAAGRLRGETQIRFVIVGEGVKKDRLQRLAQQEALGNVFFLPFQPREALPEMLAAADVSLVTLSRNSSNTSLPSKTFSIMASGRPVVSVTPEDSEIARLVQETDCGINVSPETPDLLAETILALQRDSARLTEMGQNGRRRLETEFSRQQCVNMYEEMLSQIAK
jgi:colanic acid biosynthesis glycosyl transferase WcaI